jgi:hypothetical protein
MVYRVMDAMMYRGTAKFSPNTIPVATTPRAPGNVPFFVDNIWEWLRPDGFPSRRLSAFAAPSVEGAVASAGCTVDQVYCVELLDGQTVCQLIVGEQPDDAKYHSDIDRLKRLIIRALPREWYQLPSRERGVEAILFLPCATRDEIDMVMQRSRLMDADAIRQSCSFWQDVTLTQGDKILKEIHPRGEIFFEGRFRLLRNNPPN